MPWCKQSNPVLWLTPRFLKTCNSTLQKSANAYYHSAHTCQRYRTYFRFNMAASMACQAAVRGLRAASTKQLLVSRNQVTDRRSVRLSSSAWCDLKKNVVLRVAAAVCLFTASDNDDILHIHSEYMYKHSFNLALLVHLTSEQNKIEWQTDDHPALCCFGELFTYCSICAKL